MLTIKHIDRNNTQHLIEAVTVWYEDNGEEVADTGKPWVRKLHYTSGSFVNGGHLTKTLDFGMVYVMNSNGKTVADYDLGDPS
jgi:hypothetical protein